MDKDELAGWIFEYIEYVRGIADDPLIMSTLEVTLGGFARWLKRAPSAPPTKGIN